MHYLKSPIFRQTKNSAGKEGQSFSFARESEIDHFCRKMTTFAEKIESLVPLRYSNDR